MCSPGRSAPEGSVLVPSLVTLDRSQRGFQCALSGSQGVVPGPAGAAASPGKVDEMHSQAPPQASAIRNPGVELSRVCFNKPSR